MKRILLIMAILALAGCRTITTSTYMVANNTRYPLDLYMRGEPVVRGLRPGEVHTFSATWINRIDCVAVARDNGGKLIGADTFYLWDRRVNSWTVTHLEAPHPPYLYE